MLLEFQKQSSIQLKQKYNKLTGNYSFKAGHTHNGRSKRKDLCNDLIDYFIVCFEHQCNTMRAF